MNPVAIGIDVGGTKIAGALIAGDGTATGEMVVATPRSDTGADPGAVATTALVHDLVTRASDEGRPVGAVGIGVPEYVTPDGRIASAEVLAWPPDALAGLRSQVGVIVDSDVRCAARAELVVGDGGRFDSFLFVSIGTGISHSLVVGGQLITGHRGEAIALGELPVDPDAMIRPDGARTLEAQASGLAIEEHLAERETAGPGAPTRDDVASKAGRLAAAAIASTVGLIDPEVVILGGGIGSRSGPYTESLIEEADRLLARRPNAPAILRSRLGNRGGVVGAGLAAHRSDASGRAPDGGATTGRRGRGTTR